MFVKIILLCFVISPVFSSVVRQRNNNCSVGEFSCSDGACVAASGVCDGRRDCGDGADEAVCFTGARQLGFPEAVLRPKRQTEACQIDQWQCRDGTCIAFDGKCDGVENCADKSDETFPLCRNSVCQPNWFRCTYGACVDGTAPCNGVAECADSSDELMPACRNQSDVDHVLFKCLDGSTISVADHCDGVPNCPDGSDETVRACATKTCHAYLFQCAYGACVDSGSECNGANECADGSDESDELCNRISPPKKAVTDSPVEAALCVLPAYPEHGSYVVSGAPHARPGEALRALHLNVTCTTGYAVNDDSAVFCQGGIWSHPLPKCVRFCKLNPHPSVKYSCVVTGSIEGKRECGLYEPAGTIVHPECNEPNYYSPSTLHFMHCIDGNWDHVPICSAECGKMTPAGVGLMGGGEDAQRGELPWHVGIYNKRFRPYKQICGGSLVSNTVVISAAHCFWKDLSKKQPAANYAVAIGKLYRMWTAEKDTDAQRSDVKSIEIPPHFQGNAANFQDDIAVVILETAIVYQTYVRPVCLDFGINFDMRQLKVGNRGKVAGWGLTGANGGASPILQVGELPYVSVETCMATLPSVFREYFTSDKICAGESNGTALCKGDSGGGLAFPEPERGGTRYYLRGIVSAKPKNNDLCNVNTYTTFTHILKHEHYIKMYL